MSNRAEILIEDADAGANVRFMFPDGFQPASAAHQLAQIIQSQLDQLCAGGDLVNLGPEADPVALANASLIVQ